MGRSMSDSDDEAAREPPQKVDEILENKFVYHCELIFFADGADIVQAGGPWSKLVASLSGTAGSSPFQLWRRSETSWPLLVCHAAQAGGICISIFALLICTMLISHPSQITLRYVTIAVFSLILIVKYKYGQKVIYSDFQLWAFDACHTDHLRRLLVEALETLDHCRKDEKKG
ncbi:hypothetical protein COOONC_08853 [Cooperia oncophora]